MTENLPIINMKATGNRIRTLLKANNLKVSEVQNILGFNTPQSIFKWMRGDTLPSLDNLVILAHILNVPLDSIVVIVK